MGYLYTKFFFGKRLIVPKNSFMLAKSLFRPRTYESGKGILWPNIFFPKKVPQCRKNLRFFPQLLRELSSVLLDQKWSPPGLGSLKKPKNSWILRCSLCQKTQGGPLCSQNTLFLLKNQRGHFAWKNFRNKSRIVPKIREGWPLSSLFFCKHKQDGNV